MKKRKIAFLLAIFLVISITTISITYWIIGPVIHKNKPITDFYTVVNSTKAIPADRTYYDSKGKIITVYGKVIEVLSRDTAPPRHERFIITVNNNKNLTVIYNVDYLSRGWLNVKIGDLVVFTGEMIDSNKIHKIAEEGGFLVLYRVSEKILVEVGYVPAYDNYKIIVTFLIDLIIIVLYWKLKRVIIE